MADESKPTTSYAQSKDPNNRKGKEKGLGSIFKDSMKDALTSSKGPEILSENPRAPAPSGVPPTQKERDDILKQVNDKFGGKGGAGGGQPAAEAGKVKPPEVKEIEPIQTEKPLGPVKVDTSTIEHNEKAPEEPKMENEAPENPAETPEEGDGKGGMGIVDRIKEFHEDPFRGALTENDREEARHETAQEAQDRGGTVSPSDMMSKKDVREANQAYAESQNPQEDVKSEEEPDEKLENPVTEEDYTARYGQVAVDSAKRWGKLLALPVAQGILDSNFGDNTVAAFDSTRKILRSFLTGNPMSAASTILGESVNNLNRFSDSADKIGKRMGIAVGADPTLLEGTIVGRSFKKRAEEDRQATSAALKVVDDAMVSLGEDSLENLTPEKLSQFYDTIGQANSQAVATLKSYFNGDENVTKRDRDLALRQIEVYGSVMDDISKKSKQDKEKYAADAAWLRKMGSNRNRMEKMRRDIEHKRRYDSATPLGKMSIDLLGKNVTINPAGEPVRQRDITRMKNTLEAKLASDELSPQDRAAYEKALTRITELATPYDEKQWQKMLAETNDKGRIIATLTSKRIPVDKNGSYDSFHAKTVARRAREYITTHPDITDADRKLYEQIASEADMMAKTATQLEREQELRAFRRKFDKANVVQRDIYRILTDNQRKTWNLDEDGIPASPGQMKMLRTRLRDELAGGTVSGRIADEFEQVIGKIDEKLTPGKEQENRRYREQLEQSGVYDPTGTIRLSKVFDTLRTRRDMRFDTKTGLPASPSDYPSLRRQIENAMSDPEYLAAHSEGTIPAVLKSQLESYMTNVLDPAMRKNYQVRADEKRAKATPEQMRVYNLLDDRQVAEWNLDANGMPGSKTQKRNLRNRIENALLDPSIPDPEKAALKAMRDDITKGLRTEFERSNEEYRESLYSGQKMGLAYVYDTLIRNRHIRFDPDTNLPSSPKDYERVRSSILNAMNDPTYMSDHPDLNGHAANDVLQHYLDNILEPAMRSQRDKDYEEWKRNAQDDNVRLLGEALGGAKGTIRIKPDGSISKGSRASAIRRVQDYLFHSDLPADDPGRQYLMDRAAEWQQAIDVDNMEKKLTTKKKKALEDDTKSIAERLGSLWDVDNVALESITGKALSAHQVDSAANKAALMQTAYMKKNYPLVYNALTEYDSIDEMASDGPEMNDDELREEAKRLLADPMYIANQHAVDNLRMASDTQRFQKAIHNAGLALQIDPQEIQRDIDRLSVLSYQTIQSKSEDPKIVSEYIPLSADSPYQKELDALMDKYKLRGRFKASGKKGAVNLGPVAVDDTKTDGRGTHFMFSDYTQNNIQNFAIQFNINIGGGFNGGFGNYNPQGDAAGGIPFTGTGDTNDASESEKEKVKKEKVKKEAGGEQPKKVSRQNFTSEIHYKESDDAPEDPRGIFSSADGKAMTGDEIRKLKVDSENALNSNDINEVKAAIEAIDSRLQFDESEIDKRTEFYLNKYREMYGGDPAKMDAINKKVYGVASGVPAAKGVLKARADLQQRYDQLVAEEKEAARKKAEEEAARKKAEEEARRQIHEDRESRRNKNKGYWDEQDEATIDKIFSDLNPNVRTPAPDVPPAPEEEQTDETDEQTDESGGTDEEQGEGEQEQPDKKPDEQQTDESDDQPVPSTEETSEQETQESEVKEPEKVDNKRIEEINKMKEKRNESFEKFKSTHSPEDVAKLTDPASLDRWNGEYTPKEIRLHTSDGREITMPKQLQDDADTLNRIISGTADPLTAEDDYIKIRDTLGKEFDLIKEEMNTWVNQAGVVGNMNSGDIKTQIKDKINSIYSRVVMDSGKFNIPALLEKAKKVLDDDYLKHYNEVQRILRNGRTEEKPKTESTYRTDSSKDSRGIVGSGQVVDQEKVDERRKEISEFQNHINNISKENVISHTEFNNDSKYFKDLSSKEGELDEETISEFKSMYDKYTKVYDAYLADATKFAATIASSDDNSLSGELAGAYFGGTSPDNVRILLNNLTDKLKRKLPEKPVEEEPVEKKPKSDGKRDIKIEPVSEGTPIPDAQDTKVEESQETPVDEPQPTSVEPPSKNYQVPSLEAIENAFHPNEAKQNKNDWEYYENLAKNPEKVKKVEEIYTNACELLNNLHAEVLNGRMSKEDAEKEIKQKTGHELGSLYKALGKLKGFVKKSGKESKDLPRFPLKFGVAEEISGNENDTPLAKRQAKIVGWFNNGYKMEKISLPNLKSINTLIGMDVKNVDDRDVKRVSNDYDMLMDRLYVATKMEVNKADEIIPTLFKGRGVSPEKVASVAWEMYDLLKARGKDVEEPYLPRPVAVKKVKKSMSSRDAMKALLDEKMEEHNARFEAYNSVDKRRFMQ